MEHSFLIGFVVFIGILSLLTATAQNEVINLNYDINTTIIINNQSYYSAQNYTTYGREDYVPKPPVCSTGAIWIDGILLCIGSYVVYFFSLMFINTELQWFNVIILSPIIVVLGYILIKYILIPLAHAIAQLIPG